MKFKSAVAFGCLIPGLALAQGYTVTKVGESGYLGLDLNNFGQVVGSTLQRPTTPDRPGSLPFSFLWDSGTTTVLSSPAGTASGFPTGSVAVVYRANAINDAGQIAGTSEFIRNGGGSNTRALAWDSANTSPAVLPPLSGFNSSYGAGNNDSGQVVGWSDNSFRSPIPTLWSGGSVTNLGTLGGSEGTAYDINNSGQVVGASQLTGDTGSHATLWKTGGTIDLGAERAVSINDSGQIVGHSNSWGATFWNASSNTPIDLGWGGNSWARDINNSGEIVGQGTQFSGSWARSSTQGLLRDGGTSRDLNALLDVNSWGDWTVTDALAINDKGQILVYADTFQPGKWELGGRSTLLLTPCKDCALVNESIYEDRFRIVSAVPEPETYAMLLAGLGLLGFAVKRRKITGGPTRA